MNPVVSVVIPTYNRADLVQGAIRSVLAQTFADFELIVVDSGSTDGTAEVLGSFADERLRCERLALNRGASPARNRGLEVAGGEFIAFLDDDDEWLPQKLERQLSVMRRSSPEVGAVYTGYDKIDRSSGKLMARIRPERKGWLFDDLCVENRVGTASTVLLRRECIARVGQFDEEIVFGEEYDLWIRIAKHFQFECIRDPLVRYFVHARNATSNYPAVIRGLEAQNRKYGAWFGSNRKAYSERHLALGILYCYIGNVKKGREAFAKAIKLYPLDLRHHYYWGVSLLGAGNFKKIKHATENLSWRAREA